MILLTGATGTVGRAAIAALRSAGAPFKVGVRSPASMAPNIHTVGFDWDKLPDYLPAMVGVERMFLFTPNSERQLGYVLQAIAAARRSAVRHIVYLSAMGAGDDPGTILGRMHFAAERELCASGIAWTILRPTFFMDNVVNYVGVDLERDGQVLLPNGEGKAAWVDPVDVGEVAAVALGSDAHMGKTLELTGPAMLATAEALAIMGEALGHRYTYVDVTEDAARDGMEKTGMPEWMVDAFLEQNALVRQGRSPGPSGGVQEVLGRAPRPLAEWARGLKAAAA